MAKQSAMIYLWLTKELGLLTGYNFFYSAGNMYYFSSFGRHATCVERTELQSSLEKFC